MKQLFLPLVKKLFPEFKSHIVYLMDNLIDKEIWHCIGQKWKVKGKNKKRFSNRTTLASTGLSYSLNVYIWSVNVMHSKK